MLMRFDKSYPSVSNYRKAHNDQRFWGLLNVKTGECYLHPGCVEDDKPLLVTPTQKKSHVTYAAQNDQFFVVFSGIEANGPGNIIIPPNSGDGGGHKIFLDKIAGESSPDDWRGFSLTKTEVGPRLVFRSALNSNHENNREMLEPSRSELKCFLNENLKSESLQVHIENESKIYQNNKSANSPLFFSSRAKLSVAIAGVGVIATTAYLLSPKKKIA